MDFSVQSAKPPHVSNMYARYVVADRIARPETASSGDRIDLGRGPKLSDGEASGVLYERVLYRMQTETATARTELGVPWNALADMSAEYSAGRLIAEAVKSYESWRVQNSAMPDPDARRTFAAILAGAADGAAAEARGILRTVNNLSPAVETRINEVSAAIHSRLDAFAAG